jgi:hypothetical protein
VREGGESGGERYYIFFGAGGHILSGLEGFKAVPARPLVKRWEVRKVEVLGSEILMGRRKKLSRGYTGIWYVWYYVGRVAVR